MYILDSSYSGREVYRRLRLFLRSSLLFHEKYGNVTRLYFVKKKIASVTPKGVKIKRNETEPRIKFLKKAY